MRAAAVVCLSALAISSFVPASAQNKDPSRFQSGGSQTRYFTSVDGLMDGNADVILRETYQGKTISSAVLDVCYPAAKDPDRKDRFVANLAVKGQTLTGTAQSEVDKLPVSVTLTQQATGDTYEFKGQIRVGQTVTNVVSSDNADLSEKEFKENQASEDGITTAPKDFTEVSPEAVAIKVKLDRAADLLTFLKGQNVEVALSSLAVSCETLRRDQITINVSIAPDRAAALVTRARTLPGVVAAGWTSGLIDMERTIRFPVEPWRHDNKLDRDKLLAAIAPVVGASLSAKLSSSKWSDTTGKLIMTFKRPSSTFPTLGLVDVIEVTALIAQDAPDSSNHLMLWISGPSTTTIDESNGPRLNLVDTSADDEEDSEQPDDSSLVDALARAMKAQRWNLDKSVWK